MINEYDYVLEQTKLGTVIKEFRGIADEVCTVPSSIGGRKIAGIGKGAYRDCKEIRRLVIGEGIFFIEDEAFKRCSNLESVSFPKDLKRIGSVEERVSMFGSPRQGVSFATDIGAFSFCDSLKTVVLPDSLSTLGVSTFSFSGLERISIPNGIKIIPPNCFYFCVGLKDIRLPKELVLISSMAFHRYAGSSCLYLPPCMEEIGEGAFSDARRLPEVRLGEKVKVIHDRAFSGCVDLGMIVIPSPWTVLGNHVFGNLHNHEPERNYNPSATGNRNENLVICCVPGSHALEYARLNHFEVKAIQHLT